MTQQTELPWLTLQEAAERCRLSEDTLQRWIKDKYLIPGIHYGGKGRLLRFDREMLDLAVRFQTDEVAHQSAIEAKRKSLQPTRRRA